MNKPAHSETDNPDMACTVQQRTITFLEQPASYTPRLDQVTRIDTHAAIIFLAGCQAYKIKRAVKLTYLDFRTLEERYRVCKQELEINQPHAPEIYEDIVPIVELPNGQLKIGGEGPVVEWALRMRRFDQADILDAMAVRGALTVEIMHDLAETLVAAHAHAPVARWNDGISGMQDVIATTTAAFERSRETLGRPDVEHYRDAMTSTFNGQRQCLKERAAAGSVRRCHGDLHLRNIVLLDGKPTLFDAIEFDENIATTDTLYDLAFLLMDLWHRGLEHHANVLLNRYIYLSADAFSLDALLLLPMFLSLRAAIRSMVALDSLSVLKGPGLVERKAEAQIYLHLANTLLQLEKPCLIAVSGLSGTGKSTQAAAIAPYLGVAPGACVVRSDVERKLLFDVAPETRLDDTAYTQQATEKVYKQLCRKAALALKPGHSVVADAVFSKTWQREAIQQVAADANVPFVGIWLRADEDILIKRVTQRTGDASDADAAVVRTQLGRTPALIDWHRIDASGAADVVASLVRDYLNQQGVALRTPRIPARR